MSISAFVVAFAAIAGLFTWRRQMTGKGKFDVARNIMFLGYKVNEEFKRARSPLTYPGESAERSRQRDESSTEAQVLDEWYARNRRLQPLREDLPKFQEASWEAEVLLGGDAGRAVAVAFEAFRSNFAEVASSVDSYFGVVHEEARSGSRTNVDREWLHGLKSTIYSQPDDDFSRQIDAITNELAPALKKYVK